jgi:hypothetical protein
MVSGERAKEAVQIPPNFCKPMNSAPERQHDFSRPATRQQFTAVFEARRRLADGVLGKGAGRGVAHAASPLKDFSGI